MKKLAALSLALASLLVAGSAAAAPILADLDFEPDAPGSEDLNLYLSVAPGAPLTSLSAVQFHIVSTPTTNFTISPSAIAAGLDQFQPIGFSLKSIVGNDLHLSLPGHA